MQAHILVNKIAERMQVGIDVRSPAPLDMMAGHPGERTMQTILAHIGAAMGGSWCITDEGRLRLIKLNSAPPTTSLMVDEYGDYITLGGVRIRV